MTSHSVVCPQIGTREHYAIPRALSRVDCLDKLLTDLWTSPRWRDRLGAVAASRRMASRWHPEIPYVTDSNHGMKSGSRICDAPIETAAVQIGSDCWIGAKAIILSGVEVEDHAVIGAGAVVTKSVAAWTIVAGVPAVKIGTRGESS